MGDVENPGRLMMVLSNVVSESEQCIAHLQRPMCHYIHHDQSSAVVLPQIHELF